MKMRVRERARERLASRFGVASGLNSLQFLLKGGAAFQRLNDEIRMMNDEGIEGFEFPSKTTQPVSSAFELRIFQTCMGDDAA
jgi:hypothetical protein